MEQVPPDSSFSSHETYRGRIHLGEVARKWSRSLYSPKYQGYNFSPLFIQLSRDGGGGTHGTGHTTKQKKNHPPPTKQIKKKKNQTHKRSSLKHIWWDKTKWCTPSLVLSLTLSSSKSPYHVNITSNLARVWFYTPRMFHFIRHHSILTSVS